MTHVMFVGHCCPDRAPVVTIWGIVPCGAAPASLDVCLSQALQSLVHFSHVLSLAEYVSRIVHPLIRILMDTAQVLHKPALSALCGLVHQASCCGPSHCPALTHDCAQLGPEFATFVPICRKAMAVHNLNHPVLEVPIQGQSLSYSASHCACSLIPCHLLCLWTFLRDSLRI